MQILAEFEKKVISLQTYQTQNAMKRLFSYKTWRNILCATGIPFFSMLLSGCYKYGVPDNWHRIHGTVMEYDTQEPINNVSVTNPEGYSDLTYNGGHFTIGFVSKDGCSTFNFSKEGYQTLDTTLCETAEAVEIKLKKQP